MYLVDEVGYTSAPFMAMVFKTKLSLFYFED